MKLGLFIRLLALGCVGCTVESIRAGSDSSATSSIVCSPGADHTCNEDPTVSIITGICNPDSTCTCNPGWDKTASGRCAPSGGPPPTTGTTCTPGMDQTCNDDLAMSALAGTCNPDGTCNCNPAYVKRSSGKCGANPSSGTCTPGMDQTCNDDPMMSSLAGACGADRTCTCNPSYAKKSSGKCGAPATTFPEYLAGTWLIGWSGGLDHYSWVRLEGFDHGRADFLSKASTRPAVTPFFNCDGQGTWEITAKANTIFLHFPSSCTSPGVNITAYTLSNLEFGPSTFPLGAIMSATLETAPGEQSLAALKFPDSQCDAAFASCVDPFP